MIDFSLTHRCTVITRTASGVDKYNRPTFTDGPPNENVPCFFSSKNVLSSDDNGDSYVREISLLMSKSAIVALGSKVNNIKMGKVLISGTYEVESLIPVSGYTDLSHYELTLREV